MCVLYAPSLFDDLNEINDIRIADPQYKNLNFFGKYTHKVCLCLFLREKSQVDIAAQSL